MTQGSPLDRQAPCPNCGAPMTFKFAGAKAQVCKEVAVGRRAGGLCNRPGIEEEADKARNPAIELTEAKSRPCRVQHCQNDKRVCRHAAVGFDNTQQQKKKATATKSAIL